MGRVDNYNVYLHTYTLRYKQTQEKKSTLRCASLRGVEFFSPWEKRREGAQRKVDFFSWVCLLEFSNI